MVVIMVETILLHAGDDCPLSRQADRWDRSFAYGQHTLLGNIKSAITGTYRAVRSHAGRTLAEFEYRFNRRFDLAAMIPRLAYAAVRTQPMPYRLLILTE